MTPASETAAGKKRTLKRALYHSAKISDYRFRKVLACFVRDETATAAARETRLSLNSVAGIYQKLRNYFADVGLFTDFYEGRSLTEADDATAKFERDLLSYHLARVCEKRGLKTLTGEPDLHFAESHWRYHYQILAAQRPSQQVHTMMLGHLIELIRICGPIGKPPINRHAGLEAILRQMDQRMAWLERNAPEFRPAALRDALKGVRSL